MQLCPIAKIANQDFEVLKNKQGNSFGSGQLDEISLHHGLCF
jgi:hypothetical protein